MERILRNTKADVKVTLYSNGVAEDATGTPTVTVKREDGTAIVTDAATTKPPSTTGIYQYTLIPANTADLDLLTATWTATLDGTAGQKFETKVEVVGASLFTLPEARAIKPLEEVGYSNDEILAARTQAELAIEEAAGVSLVPRYARRKLDGSGTDLLILPHPRAHAVKSVSIDGTALAGDDLTAVEVEDSGSLYRADKWPTGRRNVEVKYAHGYQVPPGRANRAALLLAKYLLVDSPTSDRMSSMTTDEGITQVFTTPGQRGAVFAIPEVNALVNDIRVEPIA